jgi:hypothetical protein
MSTLTFHPSAALVRSHVVAAARRAPRALLWVVVGRVPLLRANVTELESRYGRDLYPAASHGAAVRAILGGAGLPVEAATPRASSSPRHGQGGRHVVRPLTGALRELPARLHPG